MGEADPVDPTELIKEASRKLFDSLVQVVREKASLNCDYHKYHHYLLNKAKEKWTEEQRNARQRLLAEQESESKRTCRFCGCTKRIIKIRKKKVKGVQKKFLYNRCRFCSKLTLLNKQGISLSKIPETEETQPVITKKEDPKIRPKKVEKFNNDNTIKELNYLLKGGKGGNKLDVNQLQKSKLMDLLM